MKAQTAPRAESDASLVLLSIAHTPCWPLLGSIPEGRCRPMIPSTHKRKMTSRPTRFNQWAGGTLQCFSLQTTHWLSPVILCDRALPTLPSLHIQGDRQGEVLGSHPFL